MNIVQPTPWPTQLSEAIVGFPLWGRLRPHTERGHAITALAFHAWSKGGLGLFSYNAETKTGGRHLYACSFSPSRFKPLLIDWKEGWCATERLSSQRFQEDASRNGSVYSWSAGALPREQADSELQALSKQDQVLVLAMRMHLETQLGAFDWGVWKETGVLAVEPTKLANGTYVLANRDPLSAHETWPRGLDATELCEYLSAYPRGVSNGVDFFHFQERLDAYISKNPNCVWESKHSLHLVARFAGQTNPRSAVHASHYFHTHDFEKIWPVGCTRVVAPHFSDYVGSFVDLEGRAEEDQKDLAWLAASHAMPSSSGFDMYEHVFQGKVVLDGTEQLVLGDVGFGLTGKRGERGVLVRIDASRGEGPVLDALRQARAYCGGILAVDATVVARDPVFWQSVFARREVAALLDGNHQPVCQHPHFSYMKSSVDFSYPLVGLNPHAIAEYSLFQADARQFRGSMYGSVQGPWGWKHVLDCVGQKYDWAPAFPFAYSDYSFEKTDKWLNIRERWLETMDPSSAALVLNKLAQRDDWPVDLEKESKDIAAHYLSDTPLYAVCEMMEFEPSGVLAALHQYQRGLAPTEDMSIDTDSFASVLGNGL